MLEKCYDFRSSVRSNFHIRTNIGLHELLNDMVLVQRLLLSIRPFRSDGKGCFDFSFLRKAGEEFCIKKDGIRKTASLKERRLYFSNSIDNSRTHVTFRDTCNPSISLGKILNKMKCIKRDRIWKDISVSLR